MRITLFPVLLASLSALVPRSTHADPLEVGVADISYDLAQPPMNLVQNGGFESGFAHWSGTFGYYSQSPNTVDGQTVGILVDISHSSVNQTLTQSLWTTPGIR